MNETANELTVCPADNVGGWLEQVWRWVTENGIGFCIDLLVAVLILVVGWLMIRMLKHAVIGALSSRIRKSPTLTKFIISVVTKASWAFLIVTALAKVGVNVGPLIAGLGVTGFILGFAFQESLSNLAAGLLIAINEPFRVGNRVKIADFEGTVGEVDIMATVLYTPDNQRIVVPNKSVWGSPIINYTIMERRRVDVNIGISYKSDINLAKRVGLAALSALPGALTEPAPVAVVTGLNDSSVGLSIRAWAKTEDYWSLLFAGNQAVKEAYDREGVEIPFPQLDVHFDEQFPR